MGSALSKIRTFFTGRNREQESDLYANYDKIDTVIDEINTIATIKVMNASDEICAAMRDINKVNGMEKYVGSINVSNFETAFDSISESIKSIALQIQSKAESIKRYEEASTLDKITSTFAMGASKLGEGILTPFEEIGDGVLGLVGWLAPKDSGVEHWCSEAVKKDWAHDAFNFYYNSEFADKSTITEDSVLSNAYLVFGKTATLLGSVPFVGPAAILASGLGSGTETGVKNGKDINSAFWQDGITGAAAQGAGYVLGVPALMAAETFNQARNVKATQNAKQKSPSVEIEKAIPSEEVFTPITESPTDSKPTPPTEASKENHTEVPTSSSESNDKNKNTSQSIYEGSNSQSRKETSTIAGVATSTAKANVKFEAHTEPRIEISTGVMSTEIPTEARLYTEPPTSKGGEKINPIIENHSAQSGGYNKNANNIVNGNKTSGGEYTEAGFVSDETKNLPALDDSLIDGTTSINDILGGKSVTKVKSNAPISGKSKYSSSSSKVIPLAAGLTAAAAAGIGAKAYIDSRDNNDTEEDDEEFEDVDWSNEDELSAQSPNQQTTIDADTSEEFELDDSNYEDYDSYNSGNEELVELQ